MIVSCIFATDENGLIGADNDLPWYLPADLKHFKNHTTGHTVIMGRLTFESVLSSLGKPLPNRRNIVLTRNEDYKHEGVEVVHSLGDALKLCKGEEEVFIVGGGAIYRKAFQLGIVDRVYWTLIHETFSGDTVLDRQMWEDWNRVSNERHEPDEKNKHAFSFITLEKPSIEAGQRRQ